MASFPDISSFNEGAKPNHRDRDKYTVNINDFINTASMFL